MPTAAISPTAPVRRAALKTRQPRVPRWSRSFTSPICSSCADNLLLLFDRRQFLRRDEVRRGVLAQLQRPHVRDDGPAVGDGNLSAVRGHVADAVGDRVENVPLGPLL